MSKPDITQRGQILSGGFFQKVGRELLADEVVVGDVVVERIDHPLAVAVGVRVKERRVGADLMRLILGVAYVVQPHAGQALSESMTLHEFLDQAFVGIAGFVTEECGHLGRGGGQAGQVEI